MLVEIGVYGFLPSKSLAWKTEFLMDELALELEFSDQFTFVQENYNTPLEHTPGNPPGQLWKESHFGLLVKV